MAYVIKAEIRDPAATVFEFPAQKTMYGGRHIAVGDHLFLFASENEGGSGLVGRGIVTRTEAIPRALDLARQTPLVSVTVERTSQSSRPLGRAELKAFNRWDDGRPETELNFKLYRQATNKIVGISKAAAELLEGLF